MVTTYVQYVVVKVKYIVLEVVFLIIIANITNSS